MKTPLNTNIPKLSILLCCCLSLTLKHLKNTETDFRDFLNLLLISLLLFLQTDIQVGEQDLHHPQGLFCGTLPSLSWFLDFEVRECNRFSHRKKSWNCRAPKLHHDAKPFKQISTQGFLLLDVINIFLRLLGYLHTAET